MKVKQTESRYFYYCATCEAILGSNYYCDVCKLSFDRKELLRDGSFFLLYDIRHQFDILLSNQNIITHLNTHSQSHLQHDDKQPNPH